MKRGEIRAGGVCKIRRGRSAFSRSTGTSDDEFFTTASALFVSSSPLRCRSRLCPLENYLLPRTRLGIKRAKGVPLRELGERIRSIYTVRVHAGTSGPVCDLISHPHDTALRGRLPSENRFEHGPRTPRMPFDNAAATVNEDSLAFGFSRPRYAAFRIKPGFIRVLHYWAPVSPTWLSMLRYENAYPIDSQSGAPPGCRRRRPRGRQ